jgi:hypothetical protein
MEYEIALATQGHEDARPLPVVAAPLGPGPGTWLTLQTGSMVDAYRRWQQAAFSKGPLAGNASR